MNKDKKLIQPNSRLKEARESHGWTQKELADRLDVPDTRTIGRWERGESVPQPRYRRELSTILEKNIEELGFVNASTHLNKLETVISNLPKEAEPLWKIPLNLTACLGRVQEISAISARLEHGNVRLLTILGSGGVGKTRLAGEVARQVRDFFVDGICLISFTEFSDSSLVLPMIAQELGIQDRVEEKLDERVQRFLREKKFLLIIDNFERVTGGAAILEQLLMNCASLTVLVTSQIPLYLPGEYTFPLEPLALPESDGQERPEDLLHYAAVELFVQRAQAFVPSFELTEANAAVIVEICRHLDGLPLAIELASACIKIFPPPVLLDQIGRQPFKILTNEHSTGNVRRLTLYATMKWSYDLLSEEEQWLFRHLAVFSGECTLEAIEAFGQAYEGRALDVWRCVRVFIDRGLLRQSTEVRLLPYFTMLETLRAFGRECLRELDELEESQRKQAEYCLALLERARSHLKGAAQGEWVERLEREKENLRAALTWLIEQHQVEASLNFCDTFGKFCGLRGYWTEQEHWLDLVLALAQEAPPTKVYGHILRRAGYLAYRFRRLNKARRCLEQSVEISEQLGDQQNLAGALSSLGLVLYRQKELAGAEQLFQASVRAARASRDRWSLANALESMGKFKLTRGDLDGATALLNESVELAREVEDKESLARILRTQVTLKLAQGDGDQAEIFAWESYTLAQELGNSPLIALTEDGLAEVAFFQEEYEQAAEFYDRCLLFAQDLDDQSTIASKKLRLSDIALKQGDLELGGTLARESLGFFRMQTDNPNIAQALRILGDISLLQKDFARARLFYREALLLAEEIGEKKNGGRALIGYATLLLEQGLLEQAVQVLAFTHGYLGPAGKSLHLTLAKEYDQVLNRTRVLVEPQAFDLLWLLGSRMIFDDVLSIS